jgi:hypothetical protein
MGIARSVLERKAKRFRRFFQPHVPVKQYAEVK